MWQIRYVLCLPNIYLFPTTPSDNGVATRLIVKAGIVPFPNLSLYFSLSSCHIAEKQIDMCLDVYFFSAKLSLQILPSRK